MHPFYKNRDNVMPVRYRQSSSPQAAVIPAVVADLRLQGRESIPGWDGAQWAMEPWRELGKSQPQIPGQ